MNQRPGCLRGLFQLTILTAVFNWIESRFGFGRGCSCSGLGCGVIVLMIFIVLACGTCAGTNWFHLGW